MKRPRYVGRFYWWRRERTPFHTSVPRWLYRYVADLKERLFLQPWDIDIKLSRVVDGDEDCQGHASFEDRYHSAVVTLPHDLIDDPFWRDVVLHEMLEIKLAYITGLVARLADQLDPKAKDLAFETYTDYKDRLIQDLVKILH